MSTKNSKRSKASVRNYVSSDEDIDSDEPQINDGSDGDNEVNVSHSDDNGNDNSDPEVGSMSANTGWADAINKVLSVNPKKKSIILSKAKKDRDSKRKNDEQTEDIEIVKSDGTVVKTVKKFKTNQTNETKKKKKAKLSKNEWEVMHKLKPKEDDKERERFLCSIATKGVVQLFNAVREQQKTIDTKIKEVGSSETRRDKVLSQFSKNQFLDKLKQMDNKNKVILSFISLLKQKTN